MNREFNVKITGDLVDITATIGEELREGKYIHNTWISSLTREEAQELCKKLLPFINGNSYIEKYFSLYKGT